MAMSEAAKKRVPKSERGVPSKSGTGSYPMATAKQRGEAKALAAMHHGKNSAFTKRIDAKADRLAGKGKGKKKEPSKRESKPQATHGRSAPGHHRPRGYSRDAGRDFWNG